MTNGPSTRAVSRRRMIIAVALTALAVPMAGARAAGGPGFGMRVFTGTDPSFLVYHSANCSVRNRKTFGAVAHDRGWRLTIQISPFTGFHAYKLVRGQTHTYLSLTSPSGNVWASDFVPPHHIPSGGRISFSGHNKTVGGGFYPMFDEGGTEAVGVAGSMTCHWPKPPRR